MKAAICTRYGSPDVLELKDAPTPVPKSNEILIRIQATTVTSADWRIRSLDLPSGFGPIARLVFGFKRPRQPILGSEAAGEVAAVGDAVTRFKPGDRVLAFDGQRLGCHAGFKKIAEAGNVVPLPPEIDFTTAAALPFGGTTAMHFLRKTRLQPGEKLLVIGASGSVGSAIVQLAHRLGATVTGVCGPTNTDFVRTLGAASVVDYSREDVASLGRNFDVVLKCVGALDLTRSLRLVRPGGRLALIAAGLGDLLASSFKGRPQGIKIVVGPAEERPEDLKEIVTLTQRGEFRPEIEAVHPLTDIALAHARVEQKRKRGNLVITLP